MRITSVQLIQGVLLRNMNKTDRLEVGRDGVDALEPLIDGSRRDVIVRRAGEQTVVLWQENIACATVEGVDAEDSSRVGGESDGAGSRSSAPSSVEAGSEAPAANSPPRKGSRKGRAS
jgi:hypothetical protein